MTVSVVIPVWNDASGAQSAVAALAQFDCVSEIIIVDDCSEVDVQSNIDVAIAERRQKTVNFLRSDHNKGGGAARNIGLSIVKSPYVIFLDSDDLPTENYGAILESFLAYEGSFDFGMFRHIDSRERAKGNEQGLPIDELNWQKLPKSDVARKMEPEDLAVMVSVSAYPWNKLYRTEFLRQNQIQCTEIPVHNDVEIQWVSFMMAEDVIYSHEPGLVHFVDESGKRITNRKDADRLRVFEALNNVQKRMKSSRQSIGFRIAFWHFYSKLLHWISNNIDQEHLGQLRAMSSNFLYENVSKREFRIISLENPTLASRLLKILKEV